MMASVTGRLPPEVCRQHMQNYYERSVENAVLPIHLREGRLPYLLDIGLASACYVGRALSKSSIWRPRMTQYLALPVNLRVPGRCCLSRSARRASSSAT